MSIENAILEHAFALKELAAAIRETGIAARNIGIQVPGVMCATLETTADETTQVLDKVATRKAIADAKAAKDADLEKHVAKVEADAKAEQTSTEPDADDALGPTPLDYKADVFPVLLSVNKNKGKDALAGLLKKYGAAKGDQLKADSFAAIVADAQALLAA